MLWIVGVTTILLVLALSLLITRLATEALILTGLSREAARFQARSAFTGTGFTTGESERVVDHPVRRRVIMILMIVRSAGFVSVLISLILSFGTAGEETGRLVRLAWLLGGVLALWLVTRSRFVDRGLTRLVRRALDRWTDFEIRDYVSLLNLSGSYTVTELQVQPEDWLAGKELHQCRLPDEGVTVLGVDRADGAYVGVPKGDTRVDEGDTLIIYGHEDALRALDERRAGRGGEQQHARAVDEQRTRDREQKQQERRREREETRDDEREAG